MLGLEVRDRVVVAVSVAGDGRVLERAERPVGGEGVAEAALAALDAASVGASAGDVAPSVGVALVNPDAPVAELFRAGAARYARWLTSDRPIPSGAGAAIAEAWVGAARGTRDSVYFSVADHATAGIVRDGLPWLGAGRHAASIAWLALNPVEREDYRKTGCLEAEVASAGIVRRLIWRIKAGDRSRVLDQVGGDFQAITVDHVLDAARQGDGVSISVVRDTAKYIGMAAANLVAVTDPELLVLGGILASAADVLLEPVRAELVRRLPKTIMDALRVETAQLGSDAPAIGAARLAAVPPA
jgi:hypothetical protein